MGWFNSISFKIDSPLQNYEDSTHANLTVIYNGVNLKEYSLGVNVLKPSGDFPVDKKIVIQDHYVWVHLKNKTSTEETWVKIEASELFEKFGIDEEEIKKLHNGAELQALMKTKVRDLLINKEETSFLSRLDRFAVDFFKSMYSYFVIYPQATKIIKQNLEKISPTEREALYVNGSAQLSVQIKENLKGADSHAGEFFLTLASLIEFNNKISSEILDDLGNELRNSDILTHLEEKGIAVSENLRSYITQEKRWFGKEAKITKEVEKEWRQLLKDDGYSDEKIELVIRLNNKELLDLPYSRKEKMKRIDPGRMIQILEEKNCVVKRELPPIASTLFNFTV